METKVSEAAIRNAPRPSLLRTILERNTEGILTRSEIEKLEKYNGVLTTRGNKRSDPAFPFFGHHVQTQTTDEFGHHVQTQTTDEFGHNVQTQTTDEFGHHVQTQTTGFEHQQNQHIEIKKPKVLYSDENRVPVPCDTKSKIISKIFKKQAVGVPPKTTGRNMATEMLPHSHKNDQNGVGPFDQGKASVLKNLELAFKIPKPHPASKKDNIRAGDSIKRHFEEENSQSNSMETEESRIKAAQSQFPEGLVCRIPLNKLPAPSKWRRMHRVTDGLSPSSSGKCCKTESTAPTEDIDAMLKEMRVHEGFLSPLGKSPCRISDSTSRTTCDSTAAKEIMLVEVSSSNSNKPDVDVSPKRFYSYYERIGTFPDNPEFQIPYEQLMEEAITLKHKADEMKVVKDGQERAALTYIESAIKFMMSALKLEQTNRAEAIRIYEGTIGLMKAIHSVEVVCLPYLKAISFKSLALLQIKLFKISGTKVQKSVESITHVYKYLEKDNGSMSSVAENGLPITPDPVSKIPGSQNSTTLATPENKYDQCPIGPRTPPNMNKQTMADLHHISYLVAAHDIWDHSDRLIRENKLEGLFIKTDRICGPLTLHNSLLELVLYLKSFLEEVNRDSNSVQME